MTFVYGFLVDFCWLAWNYCGARGWPIRAALCAMLIGTFGFYGTKAGLEMGHPWGLIAGYGVGSYAAAWCAKRIRESEKTSPKVLDKS